MSGLVVTDSTCLIALERIGHLDLLPQLFARISIPQAVGDEFGHSLPYLNITEPTNRLAVAALRTQLDDGEADAIVLAIELNADTIILDDKKGRHIARRMGLKVKGTLGVLLLAKRRGVLATIEPSLKALRNAGFFMTDRLYEESLRVAGEAPSG